MTNLHTTPYIIFSNPGSASLDALLTLGVSIKDSPSAIGQFGTGFKFALATLLRTGHSVELIVKNELHTFSTRPTTIRDKQFSIITIQSPGTLPRDLGFTTELGAKNWSTPQAYRELHANSLDEGGKIYSQPTHPTGPFDASKTFIIVSGPEIYQSFLTRELIFPNFSSITPLYSNEQLQIFPSHSDYIYCRGVRVAKLPVKSFFTYNFLTNKDLTEDRTISPFAVENTLLTTLCSCCDINLLTDLHIHGSEFFEASIKLYSFNKVSTTHTDLILTLLKQNSPTLPNFTNHIYAKDQSSFEKLVEEIQPTPEQSKEIALVEELLKTFLPKISPIKLCETLPGGAIGMARDSTIWLSTKAFSSPQELTVTILEEQIHLDTNFADCTRQFQDFTLRLFVSSYARLLIRYLKDME